MSLVFLCTGLWKTKNSAKRQAVIEKSKKQLWKSKKTRDKGKVSGDSGKRRSVQMILMKIKTARNQPDLQKKAF